MYRADVSVRQFRFVVDEPARFGGEDTGAMPTEYILVAISSCYAMALGHVARKRDIALGPLTVRAVATYDGPSFSSIDLEVEFDDQPPPEIDELVARVEGLLRLQHADPVPDADGGAQTVQVLIWNAPARHAVRAESSTSSGWKGFTPGIRSSSRKPYRAPIANRQAWIVAPSLISVLI